MAGSDAGHALASLGLAADFAAAGHECIVYTGLRWETAAARRGLLVRDLPGLAARPDEDDSDAGAKLSVRAARMALELAPLLALERIDLVVSDSITLAGGWAAELTGLPWIELSSHVLYDQSRGLPPIGAGMAVGVGWRGRLRDGVLRALGARSHARGRAQRAQARRGIGLPPVPAPAARFVATLPGLEEPRPDWPERTHLIGPMFFEPTDDEFTVPPGPGPLVVVCPSTAESGSDELTSVAFAALADLQKTGVAERGAPRVIFSGLEPPADVDETPDGLVAGLGRQDLLLARADLVICGGGHGLLAKTLSAGVPTVVVPGGGDQWELANRVDRAGAGVLVRPVTRAAMRAAIADVLGDPSYAAAAAGLAATARQITDPVAQAEQILNARGRGSACD
ncbi:glycosyl transferase [Gordonia alkaliphila]|uniref:glycosyltransferase n=1 Tax=Gordonia alkaliphila TaxID=1053547 RepID=UPI001FF15313|nr:nucleotide disphospho-sugar-binding domain-containing protein [Gordonia alkaliphila]MCK0440433.1 glycosyl transferase [Gordonia alkaliphila]